MVRTCTNFPSKEVRLRGVLVPLELLKNVWYHICYTLALRHHRSLKPEVSTLINLAVSSLRSLRALGGTWSRPGGVFSVHFVSLFHSPSYNCFGFRQYLCWAYSKKEVMEGEFLLFPQWMLRQRICVALNPDHQLSLLKVCEFLLLMCLRDLVLVYILFLVISFKLWFSLPYFSFHLICLSFCYPIYYINLNMHDFSNLKDVFLFLENSFSCHSVLFSSLFKPFLLQCNMHITCKNLIFLAPPFSPPFHRLPRFYVVLFLHDFIK